VLLWIASRIDENRDRNEIPESDTRTQIMATNRREARERPRVVPRPIDDTHDEHDAGTGPKPAMADRKTSARDGAHEPSQPAIADRWRRIAAAAYLRAERRGFAGGAELEDWLEAEKQVDAAIREEAARSPRSQ
jgi:Protein of unknown function (DUF2934)